MHVCRCRQVGSRLSSLVCASFRIGRDQFEVEVEVGVEVKEADVGVVAAQGRKGCFQRTCRRSDGTNY